MARSTLSAGQTITEPPLGVWNAVGQSTFVQSAPVPSHPLKYSNPEATENICGGINEMSVPDALPGDVGFTNVVSMMVQPSPLRPQDPVCKYAMADNKGPLETKSPPVDRILPFCTRVGVPNPHLFVKLTVWLSALTATAAAERAAAIRVALNIL